MAVMRHLMKQFSVDPAMLEDDDSGPSLSSLFWNLEWELASPKSHIVAPLVGLQPWNGLKDIGIFEIHRSRILTTLFKSIVMNI